MSEITIQLTETGALSLFAKFKPPPPPVLPRSVYLEFTTDGAAVTALTLTLPSLSPRNAKRLASMLRKTADKLESKAAITRAGSADDPGVVVDLMPVMSK